MRRVLLANLVCGWMAAGAIGLADELDDARARIQQYRMGDLRVRVVDADGQPLAGAEVKATPSRSTVRFGCNLFKWDRCDTPEQEQVYRVRFAELFDCATLPFYWPSFEPQQGKPERVRPTSMAKWCNERGITAKGHPLLWNNQDPAWLPDDPERVVGLALARVADCTRFWGPSSSLATKVASGIDAWDVVNEACEFERFAQQAPKLTAAWQAAGRVELVREAFQRARRADPKAQLLINDYVVDERYEKLIESLREDDGSLPFDAIGIQSHMHAGAWSTSKIRAVCDRFAKFGLPLHFTELTILSGEPGWERPKPWLSTPEGEARQAREVERVYTELVAQPTVAAITWWDLSDQGAWQGAPAGLLRADMTPKPAWETLHRLITKEWRAVVVGRTDADGRFEGRVCRGEHWITCKYESISAGKIVTVGKTAGEPVVFTIRTRSASEGQPP